MSTEPVVKLHGSEKSKILRPIAQERLQPFRRTDGGLPGRVGEEVWVRSDLKGRSYAPKSFATGSITEAIILNCKVRHFPMKRIFDILFSLFVLIASLPLFVLIALTVALSSRGGIFFSQERVGRGGRLFHCYKFRTMYHDANTRLFDLLSTDSLIRKEWEQKQKLKNDPRVTPIGSFLRKTSLDELPQFWNVLFGDLSVVGPRPVLVEEVYKHMGSKAEKILSVRPGITGLWQVSGRSNTSYKFRVHLDEKYILKRSFFLDMILILKTIPVMILNRGAY